MAGDVGTVVDSHSSGRAYEVEVFLLLDVALDTRVVPQGPTAAIARVLSRG
jgi:hypothetical protein